MAYANNRGALRPRSSFQTAGGCTMKLRNPVLSGQISDYTQVDEIDVSANVRLNDTFLSAVPVQDSAFMEPLVNGGIMTVTNHLMAGIMTLSVIRTTGLVGTGDFIAAAHLIIASKDSEGSTFTVVENIDGKRIITIFYGVSFKNVPHLIKAGNAIVPYTVQMNYAGWVQGASGDDSLNEKVIWAVGNKYGLKARYKPYAIQEAEGTGDFYSGAPLSGVIGGVDAADVDSASGDIDSAATIPATLPDGVSSTPAPTTKTW